MQYLRFYAHPYVYSCALPAGGGRGNFESARDRHRANRNCARQLWENADYFHEQLRRLGIDTGARPLTSCRS